MGSSSGPGTPVQYAPRTGVLPTLASTPLGVLAVIAAGLPLVSEPRVVTRAIPLAESGRPEPALILEYDLSVSSFDVGATTQAIWQGNLLTGAVVDVYAAQRFGTVRGAHATVVTPDGNRDELGGGFGNAVRNQLFDDPPALLGELAAEAGAEFGLRDVQASTVQAIQPAVVLIATTATPVESANALNQHGALAKLVGGPINHLEGLYLELRNAAGTPLYAVGKAPRAAAGNTWADPSLGLNVGRRRMPPSRTPSQAGVGRS
jgi:hypothetical protein